MQRLTFAEARQLSIVEYLATLGFEPKRIRGDDYWYHAPGRDDKEPSFKVNARLNLWYDHGVGEGGSLIELGMKMHRCSAVEFLSRLDDGISGQHPITRVESQGPASRENRVEILNVDALTNPDLLFYIQSRGIDEQLAQSHCREIGFSIRGKSYQAIGFQNRSQGWELRNAWFKGSSSPKDISIIENHKQDKLALVEGFIDYLSLLKLKTDETREVLTGSDFIVLNSLSFLYAHIDLLKTYSSLHLFLDNDEAGKKAKSFLIVNDLPVTDQSRLYTNHKDVNEWLVYKLRNGLAITPQEKKSKGMSL